MKRYHTRQGMGRVRPGGQVAEDVDKPEWRSDTVEIPASQTFASRPGGVTCPVAPRVPGQDDGPALPWATCDGEGAPREGATDEVRGSGAPSSSAGPPRSRRDPLRVDNVGIPAVTGVHAIARIAPTAVPRLRMLPREVAAAPIDHRDGFLLAHVDDTTDVQGLIDISGMAESDVFEILLRLRRLGILTWG